MVQKKQTGPNLSIPLADDEAAEEIGPYVFIQKKAGHKLTQDPVLLTDFALPLAPEDKVIDLGTGSAIIPLILAWKTPVKSIAGVEVEKRATDVALRNIEINGLNKRISVLNTDFRDLKGLYPEGSFSVVISNPPYVKAGSGRVSPSPERAMARSEVHGELKDLVDISNYLIGVKGRVFYIYPVRRLFEMLSELKGVGLLPRRLKFIHTSPRKPAKLFLIEAGRGGGLEIEGPIYLGMDDKRD